MHSPSNYHQMSNYYHIYSRNYYQKEDLLDRVVDEFLLNTYADIDERELRVCRKIVWTMWDLSSGGNEAFYSEVVARSFTNENKRKGIFRTEKDIEETIQKLIHKGILAQYTDSINEFYPDNIC